MSKKIFFFNTIDFRGYLKSAFFYGIVGIVCSLTIPFFCSATIWNSEISVYTPYDADYIWYTHGGSLPAVRWSDYGDGYNPVYDGDGNYYWQSQAYLLYLAGLNEYDDPASYVFNGVPTKYDGFKWWVLRPTCGTTAHILFYDWGDVSATTTNFVEKYPAFYSGANEIEWVKYEGFSGSNNITNVRVYNGDLCGYKTYVLAYTNEDLSYIDTPEELNEFQYEQQTQETSFLNLNYPTNGETVASTTVEFSTNYVNFDGFDVVGFRIIQEDNFFETTYIEGTPQTDGQASFTASTTLGQGAYFYQSYLRGSPTTTIYSDETYSFFVIGNPYDTGTTTIVNTDFACDDLGTIAGAFCSVLVKLFKPTPASMSKFSHLGDLLKEKPPFGYFYTLKDAFGDFENSTSTAFVLAGVDSLGDVFDPIKTGMAWVLWIFFGLYAIKRIAHYNL